MAKYGPKAQASVQRELKAMEQGKLRSGGSGQKVTSRKQAIAIGLSEARKAGAKMPPAPKGTASAKKTAGRKSATKKTAAKKTTAKKTAVKKSTTRKTAAKKTSPKKVAAKKTTARKTTAKRATAKKTATRKTSAKKAAPRAAKKTTGRTAARLAKR